MNRFWIVRNAVWLVLVSWALWHNASDGSAALALINGLTLAGLGAGLTFAVINYVEGN